MEDLLENLTQMARDVNSTLSCYDPGWSRIQRSPISRREEIESFRQYIECRFNMEAFRSPIFKEFAEYFDGYLFEVISITEEDEKRYRFKEVCVELTKTWDNFLDIENLDQEIDEDTRRQRFWEVTDELKNLIGGDRIYFNHSIKKTKVRVE